MEANTHDVRSNLTSAAIEKRSLTSRPTPLGSNVNTGYGSMPEVTVAILHIVDDGFPALVECELIDRFGKAWRFIEKLPVVEAKDRHHGLFPRPGAIACQIIDTGTDAQGKAFTRIDTEQPWHVQSVDDVTQFEVLTGQLIDAFAGPAEIAPRR
jgi:hypothetical protein